MKELKNKEVIIGLVAFIILCIIAIFLILKREFPQEQKNMLSVEEMNAENVVSRDDGLFIEEMVEKSRKETQTINSGASDPPRCRFYFLSQLLFVFPDKSTLCFVG